MLSSRIGILGGGQLGLMLLQAAVDWNLDIHVLDPDAEAPCRNIAPHFQQGSLQDYDTVYNFGKDLDVITIEIEKVNVEALEALEKEGKKVYPQPSVIRKIQDKRIQKQFYKDNNVPTADFVLTENKADVLNHLSFLPAFISSEKTAMTAAACSAFLPNQISKKHLINPDCLKKQCLLKKNWPLSLQEMQKVRSRHFQPSKWCFIPS